jgi:hypothetical protein
VQILYQEKGEEMKRILKLLATWTVLFFGIGQWLFGCGYKEEMMAHQAITAAGINAQKEIDKVWMRQNQKAPGEKKIVQPAPLPIPMIITATTTETGPVYTDDLGETPAVKKSTTTVTSVDHTAYAIRQLGAVAVALAERSGGAEIEKNKPANTIPRIVYNLPEMPKNGPADIIRATGEALKMSGIVPGVVRGWLGWMAADTVQAVSRTPSHQGDYIRTDQSFNPISTTTTLPEEE